MIAEFLEVTFSRHGTCKLLYDTSLALARSSPTRRYTGMYDYYVMFELSLYRGSYPLNITYPYPILYSPNCSSVTSKMT